MFKAAATLTGGLSAIPSTVLTDWIRAPKQAKDSKQSDRRFSDPAWTENPYFHAVLLAYLSGCDFARIGISEQVHFWLTLIGFHHHVLDPALAR